MNSKFRYQISFGLNIVLAVTALALALHRSEPVPPITVIPDIPVVSTSARLATNWSSQEEYPVTGSASDKRRWLVDQLRAMGVPNKILARVVLADIDARRTKHAAEVAKQCYGDPETMAALQLEFDMGFDAEMRAALGEEGFKQWDKENMLRHVNSGKIELTDSETDAAYDLWKKLQQLELELRRARLKGEMDDADVSDTLEKAVAEFEQQMKALLGDERYAKAQQLDEQTAAMTLREEFAKANPTDAQFQELLKAQQQWNEQRAALDKQYQDDPSSPVYLEAIKALDEARDQEYRRVLGTNVFDTLQKEHDPRYSKMKKFAHIWGLDDDKIDWVYSTLKYYQKSIEDYQAQARALEAQGQKIDWDAVYRNVFQFAEQTGQILQNYLGQDSYTKLLQNGIFELNPPDLTAHTKPSE